MKWFVTLIFKKLTIQISVKWPLLNWLNSVSKNLEIHKNSCFIDFLVIADSVNKIFNLGKTLLPQTKIFRGILGNVHETEN